MLNEFRKLMPVIVRAWGGEPVALLLHRIENTRCYVGQQESRHQLGLPFQDVFAFDSPLFARLRQAYDQGQFDTLRAIYEQIPVDDLACNRYQDILKLQHDKENITDSGSVAESSER